jgi:hypothetical protein
MQLPNCYVVQLGATRPADMHLLAAALQPAAALQRRRVALLHGGGHYMRPPTATGAGGDISACDADCVGKVAAALRSVDLEVVAVDIE